MSGTPRVAADVRGDIKPYKSMITGEEIKSRSQHREHLKKHGCVEVGNDTDALMKQYDRFKNHDVAPQQRRDILRAQLDTMTHGQFKAMLGRDLDRLRWNTRKD